MLTSGDVVDLDFGLPSGREAGFRRPAVVVTAQRILDASPTVIHVVPLTSRRCGFASEVLIEPDPANGLSHPSAAQGQHLRAVATGRVEAVRGTVGPAALASVRELVGAHPGHPDLTSAGGGTAPHAWALRSYCGTCASACSSPAALVAAGMATGTSEATAPKSEGGEGGWGRCARSRARSVRTSGDDELTVAAGGVSRLGALRLLRNLSQRIFRAAALVAAGTSTGTSETTVPEGAGGEGG